MEPTITFAFKHGYPIPTDTPWSWMGSGDPNIDGFMTIEPSADLLVWTGGGILGLLPIPTTTSGSRDQTIRPSGASYVIPQLFVEKEQMYNCSLVAAGTPISDTNRYAMGIRIDGTATSDIYAEMWDSSDMSTTDLEILTGTANSGYNSFVNAIRTTDAEPPYPWNGGVAAAAYLRGTSNRISLGGSKLVSGVITDSTLYYNIYVELPTDVSTWHATPILTFRYLYT